MSKEENFELRIERESAGERIDAVLAHDLEEVSRSYIQKLIEAGHVYLNGAVCYSKKQKVNAGDIIRLTIPEPETIEALPEDIPLTIVYEDEDLLVVNKPKGMVVHPAPGNESGTLVNAVLFHCAGALSSINGMIRPGIVHRIDKNTSGLIMVAKTDTAHRSLAQQLAEHSIERVYRAIVYNNFLQDAGTVDAPVGRDPQNRMRMAVTESGAKRAVTHYRVIERFGTFTDIEARLETGRTHQIRVHMAYIKHPLLGDPVYGPRKTSFSAESQMLHAKVLGFQHPRTGRQLIFESDLPEEFESILRKLRVQK